MILIFYHKCLHKSPIRWQLETKCKKCWSNLFINLSVRIQSEKQKPRWGLQMEGTDYKGVGRVSRGEKEGFRTPGDQEAGDVPGAGTCRLTLAALLLEMLPPRPRWKAPRLGPELPKRHVGWTGRLQMWCRGAHNRLSHPQKPPAAVSPCHGVGARGRISVPAAFWFSTSASHGKPRTERGQGVQPADYCPQQYWAEKGRRGAEGQQVNSTDTNTDSDPRSNQNWRVIKVI